MACKEIHLTELLKQAPWEKINLLGYWVKLHLIINHGAEIVAFKITSGNIDDKKPVPGLVFLLLNYDKYAIVSG